MTLAFVQPLLGIPLLLGTCLVGRSGLMGGALVGDFGTTEGRASPTLATFIAIGYAALVAWFGWVSGITPRALNFVFAMAQIAAGS